MTLPRRRSTPRTFTAELARWMRYMLRENTREFGRRWSVSGRAVEKWEQGSRRPNRWILPRLLRMYRALENGDLV